MGLLDANADTLDLAASNSFRAPAAPPEPGLFHNFGSSAGNFFMRSLAEAGRSASMLVGAVPAAIDWAVDPYSPTGEALALQEKPLADRYFRWHDDTAGNAVDFWTPKANEVGTAGQVVGQLTGSVLKFLASAPLAVADAQMSTSEDLVRKDVDATTAQAAGAAAGVGMAVGIRAPAAIGGTLIQRVGSGVAINVAQGAAVAEAQHLILEAGGAPEAVAAQFDALDLKGRTIDAVMGAVFGAKAHLDARVSGLTQTQRDAILLVKQAQHMETASLPGRPVTPDDLTRGVNGLRTAADQMLRGEPVAVDEPLPNFIPDPARSEVAAEVERALPAYEPIARPRTVEPEASSQPGAAEARQGSQEPATPRFDDSVRVPVVDATGQERIISANEHIAQAQAEAAQTKTTAPNLMRAAAECLLGSL